MSVTFYQTRTVSSENMELISKGSETASVFIYRTWCVYSQNIGNLLSQPVRLAELWARSRCSGVLSRN